MKNQVMRSVCCECNLTIGCYDSSRHPLKVECLSCEEKRCPTPNDMDSHGICKSCYSLVTKRDEETSMIGLS